MIFNLLQAFLLAFLICVFIIGITILIAGMWYFLHVWTFLVIMIFAFIWWVSYDFLN